VPPASIGDLIPGFLDRIPDRLPPLRLVTGKEAFDSFGGNAWVLQAKLSDCPADFESFEYRPNGLYPQFDSIGQVERFGAWALIRFPNYGCQTRAP
jgi:hypothetical protein